MPYSSSLRRRQKSEIIEQVAGPNDEERGQPHVPIRLSLARSSSSVSFAFGVYVAMIAKPPTNLVYVPRIWPTFLVASIVSLLIWGFVRSVGYTTGFLVGAGVAFLLGLVVLLFLCRRKAGVLPLALPSPDRRTRLFRLGIGLCWSGVVLALLLLT